MRVHSVYVFSCLCGRAFEISGVGNLICEDCGRLLVLDWGAAAREEPVEIDGGADLCGVANGEQSCTCEPAGEEPVRFQAKVGGSDESE
jgi:hypothetical protein